MWQHGTPETSGVQVMQSRGISTSGLRVEKIRPLTSRVAISRGLTVDHQSPGFKNRRFDIVSVELANTRASIFRFAKERSQIEIPVGKELPRGVGRALTLRAM
jgi:hypothetical protein